MARYIHFILSLFAFLFFPNLQSVAAQHGIMALPGHINSEEPEFAPLRYGDKLYFSTVSPESILSARLAGGLAKPMLENPTHQKDISFNMALMPDASRMYFSICEDGDVLNQKKCTLWYRDKQFEGGWAAPKKLPRHINLQDFTATQPSISFDKMQKKYVLYFTSDRPGGMGGMDIWSSTLEQDGEFGYPVNLPFNTAQDEMTPYYDAFSQSLFFSSNGFFGLGGFDIYQIEKNASGEWQQPENLGDLVNSWDDELYFTYHSPSQRGYFASNRPHGKNANGASPKRDFDIYEMAAVIEIELLAIDEETTIPVLAPLAEVWEKGADHPLVFREQPFDEGLFMTLEGGKQYHIIIRAEGYAPMALELDAVGLLAPMVMRRKVFLKKDVPGSDMGNFNDRTLARPARYLNTSPQMIFDKNKKGKVEFFGLPF